MQPHYLLFIGDTWDRPVDHRNYHGTFDSPEAAKEDAHDSVHCYGDRPQQAYIFRYDGTAFELVSVFRSKVLGRYPNQRFVERWWDVGEPEFAIL